jgi:hypothetical protein
MYRRTALMLAGMMILAFGRSAEAPAQDNSVVGIWQGSASVSGTDIHEEYVFQQDGSFDQSTTYSGSVAGAVQRSGTYRVGPGRESGTRVINLHTLRHSKGILQDDQIPFYFNGSNTLMMYLPAPADWIPYRRVR